MKKLLMTCLFLGSLSNAFAGWVGGWYVPTNIEKKVDIKCIGADVQSEFYELHVSFFWSSKYIFLTKMIASAKLIDRLQMKVVYDYKGIDLETERNKYSNGYATDYYLPNANFRFFWVPQANSNHLVGPAAAFIKHVKGTGRSLTIEHFECHGTESDRRFD